MWLSSDILCESNEIAFSKSLYSRDRDALDELLLKAQEHDSHWEHDQRRSRHDRANVRAVLIGEEI